jgi:hypothetical protein
MKDDDKLAQVEILQVGRSSDQTNKQQQYQSQTNCPVSVCW